MAERHSIYRPLRPGDSALIAFDGAPQSDAPYRAVVVDMALDAQCHPISLTLDTTARSDGTGHPAITIPWSRVVSILDIKHSDLEDGAHG